MSVWDVHFIVEIGVTLHHGHGHMTLASRKCIKMSFSQKN